MADLDSTAGEPGARPRFLTPALGLLAAFVAVGSGVFAWSAQGSATSATRTSDPVPEDLGLEPLDASSFCVAGGTAAAEEELVERDSRDPRPELADYVPATSPVTSFERVSSDALDPSRDTEYIPGAVDGHAARFRRDREGPGFDLLAYRFLTRASAVEGAAASIVAEVCDGGTLHAGPRGTLYWHQPGGPRPAASWSVKHGDLVMVRYGPFDKGDLHGLVAVTRAALDRR